MTLKDYHLDQLYSVAHWEQFLSEHCSSYALDDETDRHACATAIVAKLMRRAEDIE